MASQGGQLHAAAWSERTFPRRTYLADSVGQTFGVFVGVRLEGGRYPASMVPWWLSVAQSRKSHPHNKHILIWSVQTEQGEGRDQEATNKPVACLLPRLVVGAVTCHKGVVGPFSGMRWDEEWGLTSWHRGTSSAGCVRDYAGRTHKVRCGTM